MALSPSASEASKLLEAALEQMDGIIQGAKFDVPQPPIPQVSRAKNPISEALRTLHTCLLQDDADRLIANVDAHSVEFVFNWLRNNLMLDPGNYGKTHFFNSPLSHQLTSSAIQIINITTHFQAKKKNLTLKGTILIFKSVF